MIERQAHAELAKAAQRLQLFGALVHRLAVTNFQLDTARIRIASLWGSREPRFARALGERGVDPAIVDEALAAAEG